jgi:hypothetical protein
MKHETIRSRQPMLVASAAGGVDLPDRRNAAKNASGVRLFRD